MADRRVTTSNRRRRYQALVLIPGIAFALGLAVAIGASKSRSEPLRGVYRQEVVRVVSLCSGKLGKIEATRGAEVSPGSVVAVIEDAGAAERVASATAGRDRIAREAEVAARKAAAEASLRIASLERDRLDTRLRYADLLRERHEIEVRRGALERAGDPSIAAARSAVWPVSVGSSVDERRFGLADLRNHEQVLNTQTALCEDRLAEIERSIAEVPKQLDLAYEVDRLRSDLAAAEAALADARRIQSTVSVVSPAHGRVGAYHRRPGESVTSGETLVQVFDAERPFVLLTVSLAEANDFCSGKRVGIDFVGFPTKRPLSGVVTDVSSDAERDAESATAPETLSARIRITPTGRLWPVVPPGTTALVTPAE